MKNAILIFVRRPKLGKVKTRLANTIGNEKALEIYHKLLVHTKHIVKDVYADKFVFYSDKVSENDMWDGYYKLQQTQVKDLGKRMYDAFQFVFNLGYDKVCIIGSDCYELGAEVIKTAFLELNQNDLVLGPATDGGYYLLGLQKLNELIFRDIKWSTSTVYSDTIKTIEIQQLNFFKLATLTDVDTVEDVPKGWL